MKFKIKPEHPNLHDECPDAEFSLVSIEHDHADSLHHFMTIKCDGCGAEIRLSRQKLDTIEE